MKRLSKAAGWTLLTMTAAVTGRLTWMSLGVKEATSESDRFTSCKNHGNQLYGCLMLDASGSPGWHLPHLPSTEGATVFASFGRKVGGWANCNHGAPNHRIGGWQAVNLSPEKWKEVFGRWSDGTTDGVPLFWCGQPNPQQQRLLITVRSHTNFWQSVVSEAALARKVEQLNQLLTAMGERPVPLNAPDKVDWDKAPLWPAMNSLNSVKQAVAK